MFSFEWLHRWLVGERGGTVLWKIPLGEIDYDPISDPADGVAVATLAENILKVGLLQPLLLWKTKSDSSGTCYRLIAGRRRLEALRMLGRTHVGAIVVSCEEDELPLLILSDNIMRREADCFAVAGEIAALISRGYSVPRLSRLLGISTVSVEALMGLRSLSAEQQRLLKLCGATLENGVALMQIPDELRTLVLRRAADNLSLPLSRLLDDYRNDPASFTLQFHKIWSADLKLFVNTLHRSIRVMEGAGFECEVIHTEGDDDVSFAIRMSRSPALMRSDCAADLSENVSRETFSEEPFEQLSLSADGMCVSEVFADNEGNLDGGVIATRCDNVSRETLRQDYYKNKRNQKENAEKLKFCIDEIGKR